MGTEGFTRKITAIMSADVVGYSKLMGDDEAATVRTLAVYKNVMSSLITQHRGRVIDSPGDNMLSEFASVVDAVQCAVAIQKELNSRNAELPEDRKMRFRIGINLGDVIEEEGRIFGDGVNIAARLESLADPGGICVSKTAFDHIETKLPLGYEFMGEQEVKNIVKPVGAYRVVMEPRVTVVGESEKDKPKRVKKIPILVGIVAIFVLAAAVGLFYFYKHPSESLVEAASLEKMTYPLPDKPSFAVLPFDNMSADSGLEYLCDGITDILIASFAKNPYVFVIARNSSFKYKGKTFTISKVAEELGVQYVVYGSVQKSGNRLRVAVQIVDALTGQHIMSERFEKNTSELFELQDEIIISILKKIDMQDQGILTESAYKSVGADNLDAFLKYLEADYNWYLFTKESILKTKALCEEAIRIAPNFALAHLLLSRTHQEIGRHYSTGEARKENFEKGLQLAKKTIELDNSIGPAYIVLGISYLYNKEFDKAFLEFEKALEHDPEDPWSYSFMSLCLTFSGKMEESIYYAKEAIRLDPLMNTHYFRLSRAFFHSKRYDDAIKLVNKTIELGPANPVFQHIYLAMIYGGYGRDEEARTHMIKVLEIKPDFNLEARRRTLFYKNPAYADREIAALRKAGAPEHPPSK